MNIKFSLSVKLVTVVLVSIAFKTSAATYPPNIDYGQQGDFITKNATKYGRAAIIMTIGPTLVALPEPPGSSSTALPGGHHVVHNYWDLSNLSNPQQFLPPWCNGNDENCGGASPIHAHASVIRFNDEVAALYSRNNDGGGPWLSFDPTEADSASQLKPGSPLGSTNQTGRIFTYANLTSPYNIDYHWAYGNPPTGNYHLRDTRENATDGVSVWRGRSIVDWNHLGNTGVSGWPIWLGNHLIYASDQQQTGIAIYDMTGYKNGNEPRLVSRFNPIVPRPEQNNGIDERLGGYWMQAYGTDRIVFAARATSSPTRRESAAMYVVNIADRSNPFISCALYFNNNRGGQFTSTMYVNFQDEYAFTDQFKVNIPACEAAFADDQLIDDTEFSNIAYQFRDWEYDCDGSQYARPLGQVVVFGGYDYWRTDDINEQGHCFFVQNDEPDTRAPIIAGTAPKNGATKVPRDTFIHIHIPETLRSETLVGNFVLTDGSGNIVPTRKQLDHTGMISIWPDNDLAANTTYTVTINGLQDFMGNTMPDTTLSFSTGNDIDAVTPFPEAPTPIPPASDLPAPTTPEPPIPPQAGPAPTYGSTEFPGTPYYPNQSRQLSCQDESATNNLWVVNPDNHSVTVIDTEVDTNFDLSVISQQDLLINYETPTSITELNGYHAVTYRDDDKVVLFDNSSLHPVASIDTGHGTQPVAAITDSAKQYLFVSLYGSGEIIRITIADVLNGDFSSSLRLNVGPKPRAMALQGNRLLVTRYVSTLTHGEVYDINIAGGLSLTRTIQVNNITVADDLDHGSGVPNFLGSIVISADGTRAYIAAVKANTNNANLDDDNTIRPMMATLDLQANQDLNEGDTANPSKTFDFDNAADPNSITLLVDGQVRVTSLRGNNKLAIQNPSSNEATQFTTGMAPQDLCATARTLYVKNLTDRSVSAIDVAEYLYRGQVNPNITTINTVRPELELLSESELRGLQIFYQSSMPEMGPEGYMSCASCHSEGGHDGQVWNLVGLGEGKRNTLSLNGTSGTRFGLLHWSQNFDEVQDFELQIEKLNKGEGLLAFTFGEGDTPLNTTTSLQTDGQDLDDLAAYISGLGKSSVKRSPYRNRASGALTPAAQRGQQIFSDNGCADCHSGRAFRDGRGHDVGTIDLEDNQAMGQAGGLREIRTPTLIELWDSAPYFHNGSATTLAEVLTIGDVHSLVPADEQGDLIQYLLSIDRDAFIDDDAAFPEN